MPFLISAHRVDVLDEALLARLPTIRRCTPGLSGIFDGRSESSIAEPSTVTSMNVRRHLFLQK